MFEQLWRDDRAIEGLPIRLVIALVVGVASLSVMMHTLGGIQTLGVTELDVKPSPEVLALHDGAAARDVTVTVVDPDGKPIADATVVARGGTARLDAVTTATTGTDGTATLSLRPDLGPNQEEGTIELDVKPPAGGQYADRRENTRLLVVGP
ncbi:MAG: carboxypeptidase regulatory-like domain-containing protein [Haloarculaceae archaeon]